MRRACFVLLGLCLTILPACSPKAATEGQRAKAEGGDTEWLESMIGEIDGGTARKEVRQAVRELLAAKFKETRCHTAGISSVFVRGGIYLARADVECVPTLPADVPTPPSFVPDPDSANSRVTFTFLAERFYPANGGPYWKVEQLSDKNRDFVTLLLRGESTERAR